MNQYIVIICYIIIVNIGAFILMGIDKNRARKHMWRIKEKTLFLSAVLGGAIGSILGMKCFRHKTQHKSFRYGMPIILILQILLGIVIFFGITHFGF